MLQAFPPLFMVMVKPSLTGNWRRHGCEGQADSAPSSGSYDATWL